ncbi:MAG: hypothetical protein MJ187_00275 [Alphaproteobacteria bacterium]|nr:hypothetical protein [Alphaproteobacteria bacterium]
MRPNIEYFKYSLYNADKIIDFSNPAGVEVVSKNSELQPKELQIANNRLVELITAYKVLCSQNDYKHDNSIRKIILEIIEILDNVKLINYSAFCVYFQVLKYSYSAYQTEQKQMTLDDKIDLLTQILDMYLTNRHDMYLSYGYSDQILQVMSDVASARRNGKTGIQKVETVISSLGFKKTETLENLLSAPRCYILPDKDGKQLFKSFIKYKNIKFIFATARDNKYPDLLLKCNNEFFIIEHKMTNGDGGSQNEAINEIINFINQTEEQPNIHYVSCLQGNFIKALAADNNISNIDNEFNTIDISDYMDSDITTGNTKNKHEHQYSHILQNLKRYPNNYFVNGCGLEFMIKNMVNS